MSAPLEAELEAGLRRLKLRRIRELAPELLQTARTQRWRPEELLASLVREEIAAREASNLARRLKAARFPAPKTLDGFDPKASELAAATFSFLGPLEGSPPVAEPDPPHSASPTAQLREARRPP